MRDGHIRQGGSATPSTVLGVASRPPRLSLQAGRGVTSREASGKRFVIIATQFHPSINRALVRGATTVLTRAGASGSRIRLVWAPGAFELPFTARKLAESHRYDAVVCLGAVIRGETAHFEFVAGEATRGIAEVARDTGVPTIFGVLTTDTLEQALDRAGGKAGNKGYDAAVNAIAMANLVRRLRPD